jgi:hypothetical protein
MFSGIHKGHYEIQMIPFENSVIEETFDLAFTSPPFFDLEIYSEEDTQSISKYSSLDTWLTKWLFPMMLKAWNTLVIGGHLALYINDSQGYDICRKMITYGSTLLNNEWIGIIGIESETVGKYRTLYVWKKI